MKGVIVFLADESGVAAQPWAKAGFKCLCVDTAHKIRKDRVEGNITFTWGDMRSWTPPERVLFLMAFPPCTDLAVSGARDFQKKNWCLLRDGMDLFHAARTAAKWSGCPYVIENPVGRISGLHHDPEETVYKFDPCDYAGYCDEPGDEAYTKKTCLWTGGGFVMPKKNPVDPVLGSQIIKLPPSKDRKKIRSLTPRGFSEAVYRFNRKLVLKFSGRLQP